MTKIDVILPVFNAEKYLFDSLESIRNQTFEDFRCIIIDDGSVDKSREISERFCSRDSRFKLFCKGNSGVIDTLNFGYSKVNADFVARADADDVNLHNRFKNQLEYLENNPLCSAVGGAYITIDENNKVLNAYNRHDINIVNQFAVPAQEPYLPHPFVMFRRKALDSFLSRENLYRNYLHSEDADLFWQLYEQSELQNLHEILGYYRLHKKSVSTISLVNARVQMVTAALAAISAQRRSVCKLEIGNDEVLRQQLLEKEDADFTEIIDIFADQLDNTELTYIKASSIVKYFDFSMIRGFSPNMSDFLFLSSLFNNHFKNKIAHYSVSRLFLGLIIKSPKRCVLIKRLNLFGIYNLLLGFLKLIYKKLRTMLS